MAIKQQSSPSEISLNLVNNTNSDILMSFFSNPSNLQDISNQYTEYKWDISSIANSLGAYNQLTLTLSNGTTLKAPILNPTLNGIVVALNTFQVSSFFYDVSGGSTFIKTYNDTQAFTSLEIYNSSVNYGLSYTINTISLNGTVQITNGLLFNTGLLANPISQSADVTSITTPGNIIGISGTSPLALNLNVKVQAYEIATSTTTTLINNNYIGGTPYSTSFGTSIGYIYTILVTDV
jgi:hypothetical protein